MTATSRDTRLSGAPSLLVRHVSGAWPLLLALWAFAVASIALRKCEVEEDYQWPLFVEADQ